MALGLRGLPVDTLRDEPYMAQDPRLTRHRSQSGIKESISYRLSSLTREACLLVMVVPAPTRFPCTSPTIFATGTKLFSQSGATWRCHPWLPRSAHCGETAVKSPQLMSTEFGEGTCIVLGQQVGSTSVRSVGLEIGKVSQWTSSVTVTNFCPGADYLDPVNHPDS